MNSPRRNRLVEYVNKVGFASVEELSDALGVSMQTIRRDVRLLSDNNLITRYHGGAARLSGEESKENKNTDYKIRLGQHVSEKQVIARLLAERIEDNSSVFLAIGTTMEAVAYELRTKKGLTVFTNSLKVANILHEETDFDVIIPGGTVQKRNGGLVNSETEDFIKRIRVDYLLFSVGGMDDSGYLLDYYMSEVNIARMMMERSSNSFLAIDSGKLNKRAPIEVGSLKNINALFVDATPPTGIASLAKEHGVEVIKP
ncbi:MAG: DeoR/GlpR family DNA-binding transcription regulator [Endozoicomonas sp.]